MTKIYIIGQMHGWATPQFFANYSGEIYLKMLNTLDVHIWKIIINILKHNKHIFLQIKSPLFFHVAIYCSPNKKVPMRSGVATCQGDDTGRGGGEQN